MPRERLSLLFKAPAAQEWELARECHRIKVPGDPAVHDRQGRRFLRRDVDPEIRFLLGKVLDLDGHE